MRFRFRTYQALGLVLVLTAANLVAHATEPELSTLSLKQAFDAAWARQPEARALDARREAAAARRQVADSWAARPPSLELSNKTDRLNRSQGSREYEIGVAVPIWLPGERSRAQSLASADLNAVDSRAEAARLLVAGAVRDAYWAWQGARIEREVARARLANAQALATDVAKRVKAGDLSRADQHQADGAAATADVALAETESAAAQADQRLRALIGRPAAMAASAMPEAPPAVEAIDLQSRHPRLREWTDRLEIARRSRELATAQTRSNPELALATTRERGVFGEPYAQTVTVGVRIPFGSDARRRVLIESASADQLEAEAQLSIERERASAEIAFARARVEHTGTQLSAAERRATLANESRAFFEKSFRLGETDLPTRLRIELEAVEAERQAARMRINAAQAMSQLRQSLGLLPE
jgi:cobalt-zinc-cadmium efflux system outer membrane protein